jgi:hypothetical protein
LGIFRAGSNPAWRDPTQLTRQIQALRTYPDIQGSIYFSSKSFEKNPLGWCDSLRRNYYSYPALIPPMPWIDTVKPHEPFTHSEYNQTDSSQTIWLAKGAAADTLRGYAVYKSDRPDFSIDSANVSEFIPYDPVAGFSVKSTALSPGKSAYYYITAVSKTNIESRPVTIIFSTFAPQ